MATKKAAVKTAKKVVKKGGKGLIVVILCFIIGLAAGGGAFFVVSGKDAFELKGDEKITLSVGEKYVEQGVKIIEFGKDISDKAIVSSAVKLSEDGFATEVGTYTIKYTVDSIKYGKIFKKEITRTVCVVEASEGGE